ncbi:hypothetical protein psyc5s11_30290 [Clostridium gelidum]|uniref:Uncharacterized protein n=1 Tax=Clostridium gelidum TaxID=704125 RepID=A0ABN6IYB6_9CLOT|nr:hypothetical protein [Clostridium gelidum]BCZ46962.1 hypothetical protein psyc5s11_30290 [Clostridium gelidum]
MNKQHSDILQGQLSIFDIELKEAEKPKEVIFPKRKNSKNQGESFSNIINLYKASATRIVKQVCGALLVEVEDKTLYFNSAGINELELKKDMELMPADEILVVNQDKEVNDLQLKKLKDMHVEKYIKRKGDANIIIPFPGKLIIINPRGWVLEYLQKPIYHEDELFVTEMAKENTDLANKIIEMDINITKSMNKSFGSETDEDEEAVKLEVGDRVEFNYDGPQVGNISSIYNKGETVNVVWDNKHTAFYYKKVRKIGVI